MTPFYSNYPKDVEENLRWRLACRERAFRDIRFRNALYDACMEDVLFWMAFACWAIEPRAKTKIRPFIPWSHQESVFVAMDQALDDAEREERTIDVLLDKSRAQGGTYGYLWIDLRRWLRDPMFSAGYVTRNEMLVDSATDSDTLFWKLAWGIERLPEWMVPPNFNMKQHRSLTMHSLLNPANGATLVGYAAGQDVGAGGRKTVFTIDEAGARDFVSGGKDEAIQEALHDVSNCVEGGTLVLTDYGPTPIEKMELFHRTWDGTMWVSHDGCVYQGEQETISAYGIRLTPDHQVLTTKGWRNASDKGFDREEVRLPDGYSEGWSHEVWQGDVAVPLQMWEGMCSQWESTSTRSHEKLRLPSWRGARQVSHSNIHHVDGSQATMHQPKPQIVSSLRCEGGQAVRSLDGLHEFSGGYGRTAGRNDYREDRQRRRLQSRELQVGHSVRSGQQQEEQSRGGHISWQDDGSTDIEDDGHCVPDDHREVQEGVGGRCPAETSTRKAPVYDLLNCGPRRAFTVIDENGRPVLLHNCIRMVSARYLDSGVFHEACENQDHSGLHLILDWKDNPIHAKNSYVVRDGRPEARKLEDQGAVNDYHAENPDIQKWLERKGFKYEGVVRSPWYNMRCLRPTSTPRLIASQLDRNPRGAVGKVFPTDLLDRVKREKCKVPVWQGTPVFDSETLALNGLITRDDGPLKLWFRPGPDNSCPLGPFTVGCDIAMGSDGAYSSNSVASGIDDRTGEQILEYTIKGMPAIKFARNVVGLCRWLRGAFLGWEDSGMAGPFAKEIMEVLYYGNVYYRDVAEIGQKKKTRKAGWWNGKDEHKADLFEKMALAMETGSYIIRSEDLIRECGEYEWEKGKIIHQPTKNKGATEKAHGDRVIASGVAWLLYSEGLEGIAIDTGEELGQTPEYGSWLWREQREQTRVDTDSPEFGLRDVVNY